MISRDALLSDKAVEAAAHAIAVEQESEPATALSRDRTMARAALTAAVESVEKGDEDG